MRRAYPYALFALLVCIFLWRPIFRGEALLPGDYLAQMSPWNTVSRPSSPPPQWNPLQWDAIAQFYPWRVFYARSMRDGHIPLWNPHQFCGTPFLANGQSAVLYPPNLVFLVFDPITSFTILAALHLFLAASFMCLLLRELGCRALGGIVGGITYAFSAFMVLWLELPTFVAAATWLPLVLSLIHRAVERRSVYHGMLGGLALAMAVLAGHFQIAFYVGFAALLWWVWKLARVWRAEGRFYAEFRVGVPFVVFAVMAALIAAPQVLPTQELAANSHRVRETTEAGYESFIDNAVKPYRLITAFAPRFFGDPSQNDYYLLGRIDDSRHVGSAADYMEYGLYAGILPLMLAAIALSAIRKRPHIGFFALLAVLALLVATGTPINELFYYAVPGFSALGGPNRILLLYFLGIAGLAGFGVDHFCEMSRVPTCWTRYRMRREVILVAASTVALVLAYVCFRALIPTERWWCVLSGEPIPAFLSELMLCAMSVVSVSILALRGTSKLRESLFSTLMVTVLVADVFAFGINYNPTCDRAKVYPGTKLTNELKRLTRNGERIAPINPKWSLFETPKDAILPPNAAMVYGLYDVQGYDSLYTRAYKDLSSAIQGEDSSPVENGNMVVVKRCTRDVSITAQWVVGRHPILDPTVDVRSARRVDGLHVSHVGPTGARSVSRVGKTNGPHRPFSFRLGLFLMCVGVAALSSVGVYRVARARSKQ